MRSSVENCIQLRSGQYFNLLEPNPEVITVEDIAHALSNTCRFGGHVREFYSVAQHSVMASWQVPLSLKLDALFHDASEAILVDMPTPVKALLPEYRILENTIQAVLAMKFGASHPKPHAVEIADKVMLATERRDLMPTCPIEWDILRGINPLQETLRPWPPQRAYQTFLLQYHDIKRKLSQCIQE